MNGRHLLLLALYILIHTTTQAQEKCGTEQLLQKLSAQYPTLKQTVADQKAGITYSKSANKTTSSGTVHPIPVVFHIVLNTAQQNLIGGVAGIERRIDSQITVLNRDFNAQNADSTLIPAAFKELFGNMNVQFALARTAPDGSATNGYEIATINVGGTELEGGYGSGYAFSHAKYSTVGGADAWDPNRYMNVWIVNPLENNNTSNILGVAMPPFYIRDAGIPLSEQGVVLHYRAFGKLVNITDPYISGAQYGRTLTHEMGHMFELFHIWGDDDGACPPRGSDDGIADTPPQAYSTSRCPSFPRFDGCSPTGNGIMYMNFMDYSDDVCVNMFSKGQVTKMQRIIQPGNAIYPLTQHPELLETPTNNHPLANSYKVYPNPADDVINILFAWQSTDLEAIYIVNLLGQKVAGKEITAQSSYYSFNLSGVQTGFYILVMDYGDKQEVTKLMVR